MQKNVLRQLNIRKLLDHVRVSLLKKDQQFAKIWYLQQIGNDTDLHYLGTFVSRFEFLYKVSKLLRWDFRKVASRSDLDLNLLQQKTYEFRIS